MSRSGMLEGTRALVTALAAALAVCSLAWPLLLAIVLLSPTTPVAEAAGLAVGNTALLAWIGWQMCFIRARDQNQQEPK